MRRSVRRPLSVTAALLLAACNGRGAAVSPGLPVASQAAAPSHAFAPADRADADPSHGKIKHVVILVQENRSFNNLFYGYKGAKTSKYGYDSSGQRIKLLPIPLETTWDIEHDSYGDLAACNGKGILAGTDCRQNGFNKEQAYCGSTCPIAHPEYAYVPNSETKPYFAMADEWVLADHMFASNFDASSFISHQYIISGQAEKAINFPDGAWGCPGGRYDRIAEVGPDRQPLYSKQEVVCWDPTTLGDELDKASVSWAFYGVIYNGAPYIWIAYQAINHIYNGSDWSEDIIGPPARVIADVTRGKLRSVSWVTPTWTNSDHPGNSSNTGPSWVASVVNAIGESKYWDSTAIFVFWDDYGGWYDPVPQPYADIDGLGMRLPMLVISPYARQHHVAHTQYEHGSILKFVEDVFGLGRLTASDSRANSPARDCFDFSQSPRKFVPIQAPYSRSFFLHQPLDDHVVDAE
jgi:phospholipase C